MDDIFMDDGSTQGPILSFLKVRGWITGDEELEIEPMAGGVSNDVFSINGPDIDLVLKQALPKLRVTADWRADISRLQTEGVALRLAHTLTPSAVPRVIDLSEQYLLIQRAPHDWQDWKTVLLQGQVDPKVAAELGSALGYWQSQTAGSLIDTSGLRSKTVFDQLRIDPFHREIAARFPELRSMIGEAISRLETKADCLVHGDFSPKNVLFGPRPADSDDAPNMWVIDWEVAHLGDAAFDPAFLIAHLLLKSARSPALAENLENCARQFRASYLTAGGIATDEAEIAAHVACLMLARISGKSPVDYLDATAQSSVVSAASRMLRQRPSSVTELWRYLE